MALLEPCSRCTKTKCLPQQVGVSDADGVHHRVLIALCVPCRLRARAENEAARRRGAYQRQS